MPAYKTTNYFQAGTCNTICDISGWKIKMHDVSRQWDNTYVIHKLWSRRNPQDFPPSIIPTQVWEQSRAETYNPPEINYQQPYTFVYDANGVQHRVTNQVVAVNGQVYDVSEYVTDAEGKLWRIFKSDLEWNIV